MENDKRRTKISPKSGRGLGHVTPTIFGSTVGYPSDSLASCFICDCTAVVVIKLCNNGMTIYSVAPAHRTIMLQS